MRQVAIYRNGIFAGKLTKEHANQYIFEYDDQYYVDPRQAAISLTLPKTHKRYVSPYLFPFFFNMLSEGFNKDVQTQHLRIDEDDHFGLLAATAHTDVIGPVTVKPINR